MENASLKDKISAIESSNSDLVEIKKQLLDKIDTLEDDLAFYAKGQDKEQIKRTDILRVEKEQAEKHISKLLADCNTYSNLIEDLRAENKTLRSMNNIPDNFGIPIEQIKLHDKEKIDDFRRLIQEL